MGDSPSIISFVISFDPLIPIAAVTLHYAWGPGLWWKMRENSLMSPRIQVIPHQLETVSAVLVLDADMSLLLS